MRVQELLNDIILLQRDIKKAIESNEEEELITRNLAEIKKVLGNQKGIEKVIENTEKNGLEPNLKKYKPTNEKEILHWDFIQRSLYSADNLNPRRRMERAYREGLEDVIREVRLRSVNNCSINLFLFFVSFVPIYSDFQNSE